MDHLNQHAEEGRKTPLQDAQVADAKISPPVFTARIAHVERGERECFALALEPIAQLLGSAAVLIDCGPFAGQYLAPFLDTLERPKAGITLSGVRDARMQERFKDDHTTAQISHFAHDIMIAPWPIEPMGESKKLALLSGGSYGTMGARDAFTFLECASSALNPGDFVALTLDTMAQAVMLEIAYEEYLKPILGTALSEFAKTQPVEALSFFDPASKTVKFGAVVSKSGAWLELGGVRIFDMDKATEFHPDFAVHTFWQASDKSTALVLLRKI